MQVKRIDSSDENVSKYVFDFGNAVAEAVLAAESMGIFHAQHIKHLQFKKYRPDPEQQQAA